MLLDSTIWSVVVVHCPSSRVRRNVKPLGFVAADRPNGPRSRCHERLFPSGREQTRRCQGRGSSPLRIGRVGEVLDPQGCRPLHRWVTTDESTVISKPLLDSVVVEDGQSNRCFPDPSWTNEGEWGEVFCETDDLLDQIVAPKTGPRWWGR